MFNDGQSESGTAVFLAPPGLRENAQILELGGRARRRVHRR